MRPESGNVLEDGSIFEYIKTRKSQLARFRKSSEITDNNSVPGMQVMLSNLPSDSLDGNLIHD